MNRLASLVLATLLSMSGLAFAESNNIIRMNAPIGKGVSATWVSAPPLYTDWVDTQDPPSCTLWAPDPADIANGTTFLQTSTDCQQNQERTVQPREKNSITGAYRNTGSVALEHQLLTVSMTRTAVGTYIDPGVWTATSPLVTSWVNVGTPDNCSLWTPDPSTVALGSAFQQTANDCQQSQQRTSQAREQNSVTHDYRNIGDPVLQSQKIAASSTRSATGTYVDPGVWSAASPLLTSWVNVGTPDNCSLWTPDTSTVALGTAFQQTANDCQQTQQRTSQAREQNSISHDYRNIGNPVLQSQTVAASLTRTATGTYVNPGVWTTTSPLVTAWVNVGSPSGCTNWSPNPSTISSGLAFQQTATDCKQVQERTVQAREQNSVSLAYRDVGAPQTQTQSPTVTSVRDAIGTNVVKTAVWIVKPSNNGSTIGYNASASFGSILSAEPGYALSLSYFSSGWVWVKVGGYGEQRNIPSIKVELLDASNNVTRTLSGASTQLQAYVMGIRYTADDFTAASTAASMRLTLQLAE